ncbi:MAG: hypothetical protein HY053_08690 [Proteobacteria bacterium]|nr:hypothetical protein [Pseudomonadota bacterium]
MKWLIPFVLVATLLANSPAQAEESAPDDLLAPAQDAVPRASPAPEAVPAEAPAEAEAPSGPILPDLPPTIISAPEETGVPLPPPSPTGFGLLDGKAGMGVGVWRQSEIESITPLLRDVSFALTRGSLREPALKNLAQRLALTHAIQPMGDLNEGPKFFEARVLLVAAAGNIGDAFRLLLRNPRYFGEDGAQRLGGLMLMQGDFPRLCNDPHLHAPLLFWQKLAVVCALRDEKRPQAQMLLDLMREAGESDTLFLELAEAATTGKHVLKPRPAKEILALHAALLGMGDLDVTPAMLSVLEQNPYPLLLQVKGPEEWRARMAQALDNSESITAKTFMDILAGLTLKSELLQKLRQDPKILGNEKLIPAVLRAAYALRAAEEKDIEAKSRAALLGALITLTASRELTGDLGRMILALVPPPAPDLGVMAPSFARLALLQNDRAAKTWLGLAGNSATPSYALAALRHALPVGERDELLAGFVSNSATPAMARANALAFLQALGLTPGEKALSALAAQSVSLPKPAQDPELDADLQEGRKGEALLRIMLLSPSDTVSVTLLRVKALRAMGFKKEATELALPYL